MWLVFAVHIKMQRAKSKDFLVGGQVKLLI